MRLIQFTDERGERRVGRVDDAGEDIHILDGVARVYDLALTAHRRGQPLTALVDVHTGDKRTSYDALIAQKRLLPPLDHPDPAHCILSGTGLDHLGSAQARDAMHAKLQAEADNLTDSMKMFRLGLEGGRPAPGEIGVQPEWFYKGDGRWIAPPEQPITLPSFALDGGDEAELVGLYVIGDGGEVLRVGFALGNEFADHVLERQNYLYLAHSKLRQCSFGPELRIGDPPASVQGTVRIVRDGKELWSAPFLTGEANMTHTFANIEHHHFKYAQFRSPGDVHCHFYGTATLSFAAGVQTQPGDVFEIAAPGFGRPLRNQLVADSQANRLVPVHVL
ncbi:MAG: AraD1 family protein [Caldilineaceae bacterium]